MQKHDLPSQLSVSDLEKISVDDSNLYKVRQCCTCTNERLIAEMIDGIQCQDCYFKRIPMFGTSPVSSAYFFMENLNGNS
jgi:hypothetical protein